MEIFVVMSKKEQQQSSQVNWNLCEGIQSYIFFFPEHKMNWIFAPWPWSEKWAACFDRK